MDENEKTLPPLLTKLKLLKTDNKAITSDDILMEFMDYIDSINLELYPAQEEAVLELLSHKHVILKTPTGSGKSMVALALHFQAMAEGRISYYTAPTKALVNEKFFWLCEVLGAQNVGLLTGDGAVNNDASVICCTAEILSNKALREDNIAVDYVVMDEFHYYGDRDRGVAWQIPLITMKDSVFLLMSATLGNTDDIVNNLQNYTDRDVAVVKSDLRPVPLEFEYRENHTHEIVESLSSAGLAPVYLVSFTQRDCAEQASNLMSVNITTKEEKQLISKEIADIKFNTPYGKEFSRFIRHGIGVHHAGLLPKYRRVVEKLSAKGLIKVISGTDTLGVGVNIPIHTVVIRLLHKYNGVKQTIITAREFHQISGRAGRKGFDDSGLVVCLAPEWVVENKQIEIKLLKNPHLKKKLRKRNPPLNAIPWDKSTFDKLIASEPEALVPRFDVTHGMIVNLILNSDNGYRRLVDLIYRSHGTDEQKSERRKKAASLMKSLVNANLVEKKQVVNGISKQFVLSDKLQDNFSLNHDLSLYLATTIEYLENDDLKELTMITLIEAILEDPRAILYKQIDREKSELIGKLKMEGMPYEERMEELEKVEHPKPDLEFITETYKTFSESHPWLEEGYIHPKNIAREIYENCYDFNYYVSQLGLGRSEGILLRYLSQFYKVAVQNVPQNLWSEEFENILAFFYGLVKRVDSTLIDEWALLSSAPSDTGVEKIEKPVSITDDMRAFRARVRNEMHALLRALAIKDWEEALSLTRVPEEPLYNEKDMEEAMESYFNEYGQVDLTPKARSACNTIFKSESHKVWTVYQKIVSPAQESTIETNFESEEESTDETVYTIQCKIDLSRPVDESLPLIELIKIGI
ncbi:MAG: DUF3516 domain-containing protein [Deltaproteobacteria bacterium]|nr:DUF3516 domain-containing protein [Deltaproteobacteria bacterium]